MVKGYVKTLVLNLRITDAFIKTLDFAQKYTGMIDWSDITRATDMLQETNAFIDSSEDENARLKLPGKF